MAAPRLPALHPAIADVYRAKVAALREALSRGQDRDAFEAARALIDRIVISPPETDDDPPGIELIGQLAELLRAGIQDSTHQGQSTALNDVLGMFASSVKAGQGPLAGSGAERPARP